MSTPEHVVIVGGGLGGARTAEALREQGFAGRITLIGAEDELPYERPPLSKGYLMGQPDAEIVVHPRAWYAQQRVDLRLGVTATAIDRAAHTVTLADGSTVEYDRLVLATGSSPRTLPLRGADAVGVHSLRTHRDSDAIRAHFGAGKRLVVVGAGWLGLEVAAAARAAGTEVVVVEAALLPLFGVLGPELARVFRDLHLEHGVDLRLGATLSEVLVEGGHAAGVLLGTGERIPAGGVVFGVGATPNVALAKAAGLEVDDGVLVDASLRSSDPAILAVGDIARQQHPVLGQRLRVEHWAGANSQPVIAAAVILGKEETYRDLPYFYTDQYDLGMEYLGHAPRGSYASVVIRGDLGAREFVAFWLDAESRILAAMNVNVWDIPDQVRPLILERRRVDVDRLADPKVPYAEL